MEENKVEYSEKYGSDVDEAVRLALEELGLNEDQVMVTVLEEPAKGFLGLGSKLAKVRVEKIEDANNDIEDLSQADALAAAEKPQTKAMYDFRKKSRPQQQQGNKQPSEFKPQERSGDRYGHEGKQGEDREFRREGGGRDGGGRDRGGRDGGGRDGGGRDRGGRDRGRDGGRDRDRGRQREREIEIDLSVIERVSEPIENLTPDPDSEAAKFLKDVISKMGLLVQIEGFSNEECFFIEVKGTDSRTVIGKRGQTLDALQYLTNLVSNKGAGDYKRVIIDVEGYRSRREKTLEQLAIKMAKKVLATGRSAWLEPMNPYERKVIHATLQNVNGVATRSEGEEPYRRVVIEKK